MLWWLLLMEGVVVVVVGLVEVRDNSYSFIMLFVHWLLYYSFICLIV